jgi:hypothetical protein
VTMAKIIDPGDKQIRVRVTWPDGRSETMTVPTYTAIRLRDLLGSRAELVPDDKKET